MDLIYMSDAMAYQSVRAPLSYYDRSWDNKKFAKKIQDKQPVNKSPSYSSSTASGNTGVVKRRKSGSGGEPCKICQEQQRRSLRSYIRTKSHEERDAGCIVEENEEQEQDIGHHAVT